MLTGLARIDIFNQKHAQALERLAQLHTPEALYLKGRCLLALEPELGQTQGETIRKFMVEKLNLPKEDIKIKVLPSQNPLTDHVNIICL